MVTDRDITLRVVAQRKDPGKTKVYEIMTPEVHFCRDSDPIRAAAVIMEEKQVRRLLVKNDEDHVIGVLSLADLAKCHSRDVVAEVLREITGPAHPRW